MGITPRWSPAQGDIIIAPKLNDLWKKALKARGKISIEEDL